MQNPTLPKNTTPFLDIALQYNETSGVLKINSSEGTPKKTVTQK